MPLNRFSTVIITLLAFASVSRGQAAPQAVPAASAPASAPSTAPVIDEKSAAVLHKMADFYAGVKSASVKIATSSKFEGGGQKEQTASSSTLAVQTPNKLALITKDEKNGNASAVSDGTLLRMYIASMKKYSEQDAPATIDAIIDSPVTAIAQQGAIVLMLFHTKPYERLIAGNLKITHAGQEDIDGVKHDHLRFEQEGLDYDMWVDAGKQPLIRRVKPDLSRQIKMLVEQQPQMKDAKLEASIDATEWKIDQPPTPEAFVFQTPSGAEKVDAMEEVLQADQPAFKLKGQPAPEVALDLLDGGKMSLAQHKGKDVVILDFWATWCAPCVQALPQISEIAKEYADKGVVFYAVNIQEDSPTVAKFLKDQKLDMKVAMDREASAATAFSVNGIPQTVIIGKDGNVRVVHVGVAPRLKERLKRDLDKAISAGSAPAAPAATAPAATAPAK